MACGTSLGLLSAYTRIAHSGAGKNAHAGNRAAAQNSGVGRLFGLLWGATGYQGERGV